MALTAAQDIRIRLILGYNFAYNYANPRLVGALALISNSPELQAEAEAILTQIAAVDQAIVDLYGSAGIKKADEVEFFGSGEGGVVQQQRRLGRQLCNRMSILVGIPLANDYYGESGYQGDGWAASANQIGFLPLT